LYLKSQNYADVDALCLHEYWGNSGFTLWHALRHRLIHEWTQGQHPPIILSEIGRNSVEGGGRGWRNSTTAEGYLAELSAYDAELQKHNYVIGAAVFTSGGGQYWRDYDIDSLIDQIGGKTMSDIYVGPGVQAKMKEMQDEPITSEIYEPGGHYSLTFGKKAVYIYSKDADTVAVLLQAASSSSPKEKPTGAAWNVGEGVRAKMASVGDVPISHERYIGGNISLTFGKKGVYFYTKDADTVYFIPAR
jgi:hypothetical protein